MKKNTDPSRMCAACRHLRPRSQLLRLVVQDDKAEFDRTGHADGRGMYVCPSAACITRLSKLKRIVRDRRVSISEEVIGALREEVAK